MCNPKPGLRCQKDALHDLDTLVTKKAMLQKHMAEGMIDVERELLVTDRALQKRQRQFDLYVIHVGAQFEVEYRANEEDRKKLPAWDRYDETDPKTRVITRYRELTAFRNRPQDDPDAQKARSAFSTLQTMAEAAHNAGLYLASLKRTPNNLRLPVHPTRIKEMLDYIVSVAKNEGGRELTAEEQELYLQADLDEKTAPPIAEMSLEKKEQLLTERLQAKLNKNAQRRSANAKSKGEPVLPDFATRDRKIREEFDYDLSMSKPSEEATWSFND